MKKIERIAALEQRVAALEAKLGVVEDKPAKEPKPAIAVGQVWKMRNGEKVTIKEENTGCFWRTFPWVCVTNYGYSFTVTEWGTRLFDAKSHEHDLVEIISDAPVPDQKVQERVEVDTPVVLPEPYRRTPIHYYAPNFTGEARLLEWNGDYHDNQMLSLGLAFKTKCDAEIVCKAILSFLKENTKVGE